MAIQYTINLIENHTIIRRVPRVRTRHRHDRHLKTFEKSFTVNGLTKQGESLYESQKKR